MSVFSRNGEDGILFEIFQRLQIDVGNFIEIGCSYHESNCIFIAEMLGWNEIFIDGSKYQWEKLKDRFKFNESVIVLKEFVTPENINIVTCNTDGIYNLAAMSPVAISYQNPTLTLEANAKHVITVLDTIKNFNNDIRFYWAYTSEMFGSTPPPQNISTWLIPLSPYAASKVFSFDMCNIYKQSYDLRIVCRVLFNHESHRRTSNFVNKKIIDEAIKIKEKIIVKYI
jgi:GDP-D-mannose dehydratase